MEDSFAERMRKRALARLEQLALPISDDDAASTDHDPTVNKKLKIPSVEQANENIAVSTAVFNDTKPVIAEHLTVRKSTEIIECDDPGVFILRSRRKPTALGEEECTIKKDDYRVKHCKNRLGTLANKFKTFDEEDSVTPLHPVSAQKQITSKRRSKEYKITSSDIRDPKAVKPNTIIQNFSNKGVNDTHSNLQSVFPENSPKRSQIMREQSKSPEKLLNEAVISTLESQGFSKSPDSRLVYNFQLAKGCFDKENIVNPIPKPKRQFVITKSPFSESNEINNIISSPVKQTISPSKPNRKDIVLNSNQKITAPSTYDPKEISKIFSNSKFKNNVFVQQNNSRANDGGQQPDPCMLSVAERKRLFEKRLRGEIDTLVPSSPPAPSVFKSEPTLAIENIPSPRQVLHPESESDEYVSGIECNENESESNEEYELTECEEQSPIHNSLSPSISTRESESEDEKEADLSSYPVLQTVKQVKFASTPKPGRLYPSVSDLDDEAEEHEISKVENLNRSVIEDSFGKDVLCATNSIFSSFQNSRKETTIENEKAQHCLLNEVKELINPDANVSLSFSSTAQHSANSVECPNETASFTYMKVSSDPSAPTDININYQCEEIDDDLTNNSETSISKRIRCLEEQIVKEKIILAQEIRALKYCLSTSFLNSCSHLEAEKLVLLSELRIEETQNEIQRIKVENSVDPVSIQNIVRGNVTISNIRLPIKTAVVRANLKEDLENNFMCIVKCGATVIATEVIPVVKSRLREDLDGNYIQFSDKITIPNITSDFRIRVEVYNLMMEKKDFSNVKGKEKDKKSSKTPKKMKKGVPGQYGEERRISQSSFKMAGYMVFSQNLAQRHQWMLNKHHLPLVGMILMDLDFKLAKITVQKHGFLTMYEVISGYGAWSRYWFYLNGDKLSFWKYPEQETMQEAINTIDMKKCITKDVIVVGYDVVFRPQTFILKFNPPSYLQQFKGLPDDRLLLSADTEKERIAWCECLNEVLKSVRSWTSSNQ